MNYFVILLVTSLSSLTVRGQCPFPGKSLVLYGERGYVISYSLTTNRVYIDYTVTSSAVTTCDGSSKAGPQVYIDFYKINSPCTCTVTPSISGNLYITAEKVTVSSCTTTIIVRDTRYTCPTERTLSPLNVIANQSVTVTASYEENYNYGTFHHCLGFYQSSDDVQVTCGSGSTTQTTTPEKTTVYITSTPMSSAEMTVSPTHQDNSSTVSNELRMGTEPAGNKLARQCPFSVADQSITTCDGSSKAGAKFYIDFHKINSPCTCTVIPSISGSLYIQAEEVHVSSCKTIISVENTHYTCPTQKGLSSLNVIENQSVAVTASYQQQGDPGTFFHCMGFYQLSNDVQVTCASGSTTQTTTPGKTTVYITSTQISSTGINMTVSPIHQDHSTTVSDTSPMTFKESVDDKLTYIIAGAGGGFVVILIIMIIVICVRMRKKTPENKSAKGKLNTEHKNDAYDREADLPYNPLYHSNKPEDDVGYSIVEEQHHNAVPPLQTNTDHSHNSKSPETKNQNKDHTHDIPMYAVPNKPKNTPTETTGGAVYAAPNKPNNTPTETAGGAVYAAPNKPKNTPTETTGVAVYAVPNKPKNTPTETTGGAVYAQINKPKTNTAQTPVRTQNQEGLVYMEVEHSDDPITQNAPHINVITAENMPYAEIQK
ncbi:uncharacterized protein LOC125677491 [Ostrea edulis]|uniref:uncharacterized protein LOC125677491 n=1 Tax=Ostrea edulis TaxID=37623 RepID=UPI0024AFB24D|nr:uncharacterized protein LOC125677491 [Ostrea edulis]